MDQYFNFLTFVFLGNSLHEYTKALIIFLALLVIFAIFNKFAINWLAKLAKKTKTDLDEVFVSIFSKLRPPFYIFLAFYFATWFIEISELFSKFLTVALVIWVVYQSTIASNILVNYIVEKYSRKERTNGTKSAIKLIGKIGKGVLWVVAGLFVLSNLGVDITSLVAGLGIGGIAVALALQNVLSDLFSSFSIYFDKPFVPGDFIVVGNDMGTVEHIGVKTTRLRALQGEEIVISNQELTNARIHNFKKMKDRRVSFSFGITYETPNEKLKKIPGIVKDIIESIELARFDRAHFKSFNDSSLDFEIVYFAESPDYNTYMDVHEKINLGIKKSLEKAGISMAYPTRTVYVQK